jgi:hypothetical protein
MIMDNQFSVEFMMGKSSFGVMPFTHTRADLSELAEQAKTGTEKIITKTGESNIASIDAKRLDCCHQPEKEHVHLLLIDEASKGLDDIATGQVNDARAAIKSRMHRLGA